MKKLFCDASFDWKQTEATSEPVVRGKIAIVNEELKVVEKTVIGKVEGLRQYINILELTAIARAIEIAKIRNWNEELHIVTDSQIAMCWAINGKVHPKVQTGAHVGALEYLARVKKEYGNTVVFLHIKRDLNPAGWVLEEELKKEPPHTI